MKCPRCNYEMGYGNPCGNCGLIIRNETDMQRGTLIQPQEQREVSIQPSIQGSPIIQPQMQNPNGIMSQQPAPPRGAYQQPYGMYPYGYPYPMPVVSQREEPKQPSSTVGKIIGIIGGSLAMTSIFLPFMTISMFGATSSVRLIEGGIVAYIYIAIALWGIISACITSKVNLIVSGVILLLDLLVSYNLSLERVDEDYRSIVQMGTGMYFGIFGCILLIVGGIVMVTELAEK